MGYFYRFLGILTDFSVREHWLPRASEIARRCAEEERADTLHRLRATTSRRVQSAMRERLGQLPEVADLRRFRGS
jgi:hypothetical protein